MITEFLRDPLVSLLWALAVLSLAVFVLTVWRSVQAGTFDVHKLPKLLDTLVLRKLVPLTVLGVAALAVADTVTRDVLVLAYLSGITAAAAAEARQLIDAVKGDTMPDLPMDSTP
jgi:hypothetical protein